MPDVRSQLAEVPNREHRADLGDAQRRNAARAWHERRDLHRRDVPRRNALRAGGIARRRVSQQCVGMRRARSRDANESIEFSNVNDDLARRARCDLELGSHPHDECGVGELSEKSFSPGRR